MAWTAGRVIVAAALALAGCSGSGGSGGGGGGGGVVASTTAAFGDFFRATPEAQTPITAQLPEVRRCPRVKLQPQTEVIRRDDGSGDPKKLKWQASITTTARECRRGGDGSTVSMRVGVAGRVVVGPSGAPGRVELPIRIAVAQGTTVASSQLRRVSVDLSGSSQDWAYVEEEVLVTAPNSSDITVGFDG